MILKIPQSYGSRGKPLFVPASNEKIHEVSCMRAGSLPVVKNFGHSRQQSATAILRARCRVFRACPRDNVGDFHGIRRYESDGTRVSCSCRRASSRETTKTRREVGGHAPRIWRDEATGTYPSMPFKVSWRIPSMILYRSGGRTLLYLIVSIPFLRRFRSG